MSTTNTSNLEIEKLFADTIPLTKADLDSFGRKNREIMECPSFKAGCLKDQFIHAILEALDADGISQSELAELCGKSRQALNKQLDTDKPANFTIDTMVELMHHLGRRVELHYLRNSEETMVLHFLKEKQAPDHDDWEQADKKVAPIPKDFAKSKKSTSEKLTKYEHKCAA